jgi:choline-sulfatase
LVAPPADYARYRERIARRPIPDPDGRLLHPAHRRPRERFVAATPDEATRARAAYYGLVTHTDRQVARLVEAASAPGTVIVYTSDHGEMMGEHGLWGKNTCYEGSVGVPLIVSCPSFIRPGVATPSVGLIDLGPTLLELAGAPPLPGADGRSFASLLHGTGGWRDETLAEFVPETAPIAPQRMIRSGPWKYVHHHGAAAQLFRLDEDPDELVDRIADPACAAIAGDLGRRALAGWDPEAIIARLRDREATGSLLARCVGLARPWEPDPPWFDRPLANAIASKT